MSCEPLGRNFLTEALRLGKLGNMTDQAEFAAAQARVKTLAKTPGPTVLLELYALYKQGSLGEVQGDRPGLLDIKGRAKYDAWKKKAGMSMAAAQRMYIDLVEELLRTY